MQVGIIWCEGTDDEVSPSPPPRGIDDEVSPSPSPREIDVDVLPSMSTDERVDDRSSETANELCSRGSFPAKVIGELLSIMTASSIVMSLTASMSKRPNALSPYFHHVHVLVFFLVSSSLGGTTNPGAMKLLGYSQKLYMTGRLAVANVPWPYRDFTEQFNWSMFDNGERPAVSLQRQWLALLNCILCHSRNPKTEKKAARSEDCCR